MSSSAAPATPSSGYGMVSVDEAQQTVLLHSEILPKITKPTLEAIGYVAAEDVCAADPLPPFPASIKDGYAVKSGDGPGEYPVERPLFAGKTGAVELQDKTVNYITTGAPVPQGADAVVQIEDTEFLGNQDGRGYVRIKKAVRPGQDIRPIGSDIAVGAQILGKGDLIGAAEIGLLATIAHKTVEVVQKPKVAILSTGDELLEFNSDKEVQLGEIRDANRPMLLAACHERGLETIDLGIAKDDEAVLRERIHSAIAQQANVIVCSGGVSMGSKDAVKPVLESMGIVHFGKVKMKPGKPLTFAILEPNTSSKVLFFGLPAMSPQATRMDVASASTHRRHTRSIHPTGSTPSRIRTSRHPIQTVHPSPVLRANTGSVAAPFMPVQPETKSAVVSSAPVPQTSS